MRKSKAGINFAFVCVCGALSKCRGKKNPMCGGHMEFAKWAASTRMTSALSKIILIFVAAFLCHVLNI